MDAPFFSLVVPTVNRTIELVALFDSLRKQTLRDFELILVDQNEDDRLVSIVQQYSDLSITHIYRRKRGASAARNAGLKIARGSIITFPDDDCEYKFDFLENVREIFDENLNYTGITVFTRDKNFKGSIGRIATKGGPITKFNILPRSAEFSICVRSAAIEGFYFDEELGVGAPTPWWSDEGPDFILRLIQKGAYFHYYPNLVIYHPNPVRIYDEKAFVRSYKYGCGRGKFLRKHSYPIWFVGYIWSLYLVGVLLGVIQFDQSKIRYYFLGLKGRIQGYLNA